MARKQSRRTYHQNVSVTVMQCGHTVGNASRTNDNLYVFNTCGVCGTVYRQDRCVGLYKNGGYRCTRAGDPFCKDHAPQKAPDILFDGRGL